MSETLDTEDFTAAADGGWVLLDGRGLASSLHPGAALRLAGMLTDAASEAIGQRRIAQIGHDLE